MIIIYERGRHSNRLNISDKTSPRWQILNVFPPPSSQFNTAAQIQTRVPREMLKIDVCKFSCIPREIYNRIEK